MKSNDEDLITFDDEPAITSEIGEASTSMAALNISSIDPNGFECIPVPLEADAAAPKPTKTGLLSEETNPVETSLGEEEYTFQIKDVTDYSKATHHDSLEIAPSESSEGLLRGWSQDLDENNSQNQGLINTSNDNNHSPGTINNLGEEGVPENNREKALKALKKGAVAVTGTALVVAGIPLIPMPTPGGVIVSGSGLALLATEFPAAQKVLDKSRDGLERMVGEEGDDDDEDDESDDEKEKNDHKDDSRPNGYAKLSIKQNEDERHSLSVRSNYTDVNYTDADERSIFSENSAFVKSQRSTEQRIDDAIKNAKKSTKKTKKNIKKFVRGTILPLMSKITTDKEKAPDAKAEGTINNSKKTKDSTESGITDIPENFLSDTKLVSGRKDSKSKVQKSLPQNLEGAFPVQVPSVATENLLDK